MSASSAGGKALALLEAGHAHLEVGAQGGEGGGPLVEAATRDRQGVEPLGPGHLVGLQAGQGGFELGDAGLLPFEATGRFGRVGGEGLGLGGHVLALGPRARSRAWSTR